jgi:peptidoglycan/LPS O-acetylase OafA/YrhL
MEFLYRIILFVTGVVQLIPFSLWFLNNRMLNAYGESISSHNMQQQLRYWAFLFGMIGFGLIYSAIKKKSYLTASLVGLISIFAFVGLYYFLGDSNSLLQMVMRVDILVGAALLLITVLYYTRSKNAKSNL